VVQKFSIFYKSQRFITAFTNAHHLSLSCARSIQSLAPTPTHFLKNHLRLGRLSGLFASGFPHQNPVQISLLLYTYHMSRPTHSYWFDYPNNVYTEHSRWYNDHKCVLRVIGNTNIHYEYCSVRSTRLKRTKSLISGRYTLLSQLVSQLIYQRLSA
jgi:hypothetical protein